MLQNKLLGNFLTKNVLSPLYRRPYARPITCLADVLVLMDEPNLVI